MLLRSVTCGFWRGDFAIFWLKCLTGKVHYKENSDPWGQANLHASSPAPVSTTFTPCSCLYHSDEGVSVNLPLAPTPLHTHTHTHTHNTHTHGFHLMSRLVPRQNWWWWAKETGKNSSGRLAGLGLWQQAANSFISCFAEYKSAETF